MSNNGEKLKTSVLDQFSHALICLYFFCAPWGVYNVLPIDNSNIIEKFFQQEPVGYLFLSPPATLLHIFYYLIPLLFLLCLVVHRSWPLPLELTWPLLGMLAVTLFAFSDFFWVDFFFNPYYTSVGISTLLMVVCVPHWSTVRDSLWLMSLSAACMGVLSVLGILRIVIPVYLPTLHSPALIPAEILSWLLFSTLASFLLMLSRVSPWWMRCSSALLVLVCGILCAYFGMQAGLAFERPNFLGFFSVLGIGLVLWFLARLLAKAWIRAKELRKEGSGHSGMLLGISALLILFFLLSETVSGIIHQTYLLPLLIAYIVLMDRPERLAAPPPHAKFLLLSLPPILALLIFNVFTVSNNYWDTRNYQAQAPIFMQGYYTYERPRYQSINQLFPGERNTWHWIARARLEQGDADGSVPYYLKSLEPGDPVIVKEYPESFRDAYLSELRDAASGLGTGQTGLPYERVLLATGDSDAAASLLSIKIAQGDPQEIAAPHNTLLWVLEKILDTGALEKFIVEQGWDDKQLAALLNQQGVKVVEGSTPPFDALSLLVQEDRIAFELLRNGRTSGGVFNTPSQLFLDEKFSGSFDASDITFDEREISTPAFSISLGDTSKLHLKPIPPQSEHGFGSITIRPFTRRIMLIHSN